MQPPAGQKNAPESAQKVLRRYLGQEKVSKSARNGTPGRKMLIDSILFISLRDFSEKFI